MSFNDHIIQLALLGTEKGQINTTEADEFLLPPLQTIIANEKIDKEETFLQAASLAFNYRQAGAFAEKITGVDMSITAEEEKPYCSEEALHVLKDTINTESVPLLHMWLQGCENNGFVVKPQYIPSLLETAMQQKKLQTVIANCCGKRGKWLMKFNKEWNFAAGEDAAEIWETGTLEQRKQVLEKTRKEQPANAITFLQKTWQQEDANAKVAFLEILHINLSENDKDFLTGLQTEKSKKVKEAVLSLLKVIPSSDVVKLYIDALSSAINIKKERTMLGLSSRQVLQIQLPQNHDEIYKNNIEKLSGIKGLSDEDFVACQLIKAVPPAAIKNILQLTYDEIATLFLQKSVHFLYALTNAAILFKDVECLKIVLFKKENDFYKEAISILPPQEAIDYAVYIFQLEHGTNNDHIKSRIIDAVCRDNIYFGEKFSGITGKHIASKPYEYNKKFFNQHIHLIHSTFTNNLESFAPKEEYYKNIWNNQSDNIITLMNTRKQIEKIFYNKPIN